MDPSFATFSIDPSPPIPPPPIIPVIANPTTTVAGGLPPSFNHPPYSDMICEAIGALKDKNGSSKRAIAKYIESAYNDLPPTHSALLTHHLKSLKNNGILIMVKKSYKLASSTSRSEALVPDSSPPNPSDASVGPKRGRGRPPKPKSSTLPVTDPNSQQPVSVSDGPKKSPGRPKKNGPVEQLGVVRKGRGRPPKTGPKKSTGRLRKPKTVRSVVGANAMKRGRGRPPNQVLPHGVLPIQGQPMAVPYADTAAATTASVDVVNSPRPRGRPKGSAGAAAAGAGLGVVIPGKRRGRPPKIGAGVTAKQPIKPKKTTGKPVGRPKKQSKVKQAVGVLKPQFTGESNISAIGAIQELEGLAAMDVSKPFKEDAQLPVPAPPPPPTQPPLGTE
ncbi:hypothetical protein REPUB_Repub04eG0242100 [Reevesia pubescens]